MHQNILVYMIRILTLIYLRSRYTVGIAKAKTLTSKGFFGSIDDARRLFPSLGYHRGWWVVSVSVA